MRDALKELSDRDLNQTLFAMQLYESKVTRHGNMLVGLTQSGKSRAW